MGLAVVVVVAGMVVVVAGMAMMVEGCDCCGVTVARLSGWMWAHFLPRMLVRHQPCLNEKRQQRKRSRRTATATEAPTSRFSINEM